MSWKFHIVFMCQSGAHGTDRPGRVGAEVSYDNYFLVFYFTSVMYGSGISSFMLRPRAKTHVARRTLNEILYL